MRNYTKKSEPWITINGLLIVFYMLYAAVQNLQFEIDGIASFAILLLLVPYALYYTFIKPYANQDLFLKFLFLSLAIGVGYQLLTSHPNTPYPILSYLIIFAKMFVPLIMFIVLIKKGNDTEQKMVFVAITLIMLYVLITTIIEFSENENVVHQMSNMNYENFLKDAKNIASMDQSYAVLPISILAVYTLQRARNKLLKLLAILSLILIVAFIFVAQFTSILFIMMICIVIELILMNKNKKGLVISIGCAFLLFLLLPSLLTVIAQEVQSENMRVRILEVVAFLSEGDLTGYNMSSRMEMYKEGIVAFFKSPLWGNYSLKANPHSSFIQFAADLGLLGLLSFVYMVVKSKKRIGILLTNEGNTTFKVAYLTFIITACINPVIQFPTMSMMMFLYVPLGIVLIDKSTLKKNSND